MTNDVTFDQKDQHVTNDVIFSQKDKHVTNYWPLRFVIINT